MRQRKKTVEAKFAVIILAQVQLLHCIEQVSSEGGANQFVDGFYVAHQLKENDPKSFDLLSTSRFQFVDFGKDMFGEFSKKFARRIIE